MFVKGRLDSGTRVSGTETVRIAVSERVYKLIVKIIELSRNRWLHPLIVHLARTIYRFSKPLVKVPSLPAFLDLLFVVKFDLGYQEAGETAGVVVKPTLVLRNLDGQVDRAIA